VKHAHLALGALMLSVLYSGGCSMVLGIDAVPEQDSLATTLDPAAAGANPRGSTGGTDPSIDGGTGGTGPSAGGSSTGAEAGMPSSSEPSCDVSKCQALLAAAAAQPTGCAIAACDATTNQCVYSARDADGDAHTAAACSASGLSIVTGDDCDDTDATVFPGKTVKCAEDETGKTVAFPGGEPRGACSFGVRLCQPSGKFAACTGLKPPGVLDCKSASDNDCDGKADDTECGVCTAGETQACYDGPGGTSGHGRCHGGTRTCVLSGGKTSWGACTGEVVPATTDTCDRGNDDNCNGHANDSCGCINGDSTSCSSALGAQGTCAGGTSQCSDGHWGVCSIGPGSDTCDRGNDDSCNGTANEGCECLNGDTAPGCGTTGAGCSAGTQTCSGGGWGACEGNTCVDFTATSGVDNACGPNCFNGTSCSWSNSVCPNGSHVISCSVTNTGGKGACVYDGPNGTSASWHGKVSGCDGTHCVLNSCVCRHNGF
jgi:hypothetical protein